jgi:hypothetical protein
MTTADSYWGDSAYALRAQIARLERLRPWNPLRIDPILVRLHERLEALRAETGPEGDSE